LNGHWSDVPPDHIRHACEIERPVVYAGDMSFPMAAGCLPKGRIESGIRSMERGIVPAGRDPRTGEHRHPSLELTRLAIPRRVYTQAHMDIVAEAVEATYARRDDAKGLAMTYEPRHLRFFQARFLQLLHLVAPER
jgi:tryptophanase